MTVNFTATKVFCFHFAWLRCECSREMHSQWKFPEREVCQSVIIWKIASCEAIFRFFPILLWLVAIFQQIWLIITRDKMQTPQAFLWHKSTTLIPYFKSEVARLLSERHLESAFQLCVRSVGSSWVHMQLDATTTNSIHPGSLHQHQTKSKPLGVYHCPCYIQAKCLVQFPTHRESQ